MWLLTAAVRQAIENAYASGAVPSVEAQADYEARYGMEDEGGAPRILTIAGDTADIAIGGVITKAPSLMAMLFGGGNVTYSEIRSALAEADKDPEVKRARLIIDSPGGSVDGLFDAVAAIQSFSKPLDAVLHNTAASAAYALASQADTIQASNRAVRIGSIGVAVAARVSEDEYTVTSTEAPKKRPDVRTEEGRAMVREELDALHAIFVDAIADGRGTTADKVNAEYGQGATLLAEEAQKRGMIDTIAEAPLRVVKSATPTKTTAQAGGKPETGPMNRNQLMAEHPDVYAAVVQEGVEKERDRVTAHLTMGEASGDIKTAIEAAQAGTEMTSGMNAKYMAAGMNRSDQQRRAADDSDVSAADGAHDTAAQDTAADQVCSIVEGSNSHFASQE